MNGQNFSGQIPRVKRGCSLTNNLPDALSSSGGLYPLLGGFDSHIRLQA